MSLFYAFHQASIVINNENISHLEANIKLLLEGQSSTVWCRTWHENGYLQFSKLIMNNKSEEKSGFPLNQEVVLALTYCAIQLLVL